ncbi:phage protein Gp37 [Sodalis sp. (in: enterobacteria)]|uniref:phage protein Gp37 n=1 Tax=Sodalis sp. (in: enterobacteria) TaxID=1898979 RepID=UPI003F68220F
MISEIENAMMARLKAGLGRMVSAVGSYGGKLEDVGAITRVLPACWVTFLGVQQTHNRSVLINTAFTPPGVSRYCWRPIRCARKRLSARAARPAMKWAAIA